LILIKNVCKNIRKVDFSQKLLFLKVCISEIGASCFRGQSFSDSDHHFRQEALKIKTATLCEKLVVARNTRSHRAPDNFELWDDSRRSVMHLMALLVIRKNIIIE